MFLCLYFCRNLADVSNDNLMNVSEFIVALHLINGVLGGKQVPKALPENLEVPSQEEVPIEVPSVSEREAYNTVFQKCDQSGKGLINGEISDKSLFFLPTKIGNTELFYQKYRHYWQSLIPSIPVLTLKFLTNLTSGKSLSSIYIYFKKKSSKLHRILRLFVSRI